MKTMNIFNETFLNAVSNELHSVCSQENNNGFISSKNLCERLNIDATWKDVVSLIVSQQLVEGFKLSPGKGISFIGTTTIKNKQTTTNTKTTPKKTVLKEMPNNFVPLLKSVLDSIVPTDGSTVKSTDVQEHLNMKDTLVKQWISNLIKTHDLFVDYKIARGRFGGISRIMPVNTSADEPTETLETFENSGEPEAVSVLETLEAPNTFNTAVMTYDAENTCVENDDEEEDLDDDILQAEDMEEKLDFENNDDDVNISLEDLSNISSSDDNSGIDIPDNLLLQYQEQLKGFINQDYDPE